MLVSGRVMLPPVLDHKTTTPADPLAGVKWTWSKPMSNATAKSPNHDAESQGQILASTRQTTWVLHATFQPIPGLVGPKIVLKHQSKIMTHNSYAPKRTAACHMSHVSNFCQHTRSPSAFPPELAATVSRRQRRTP